MQGTEYLGDDFIYAVMATPVGGGTATLTRPFNQTDGGSSISRDTVELDTKDRSGAGYGKKTETISLEGVLTQDDPFIPFIKAAIRAGDTVDISEINTRTLDADQGSYIITKFDKSNSKGDWATYSLEGTLDGEVTTSVLTAIPAGVQTA